MCVLCWNDAFVFVLTQGMCSVQEGGDCVCVCAVHCCLPGVAAADIVARATHPPRRDEHRNLRQREGDDTTAQERPGE